jgi:quinol monooxygenase YgiN
VVDRAISADTATTDREEIAMATLFVRHQVADYAAWREVYDANAAIRDAGGVLAAEVFQGSDDPNDVTVTHDFASREAAEAFIGNPNLRKAMAEAGVVGEPTVWSADRR